MCEKVRTLAQSNDYRRVTICEHGSVNLIWDNCALYLPWPLFAEAHAALEACAPKVLLREAENVQSGLVSLALIGESGMMVWLNNLGLKLTLRDFLAFRTLLQGAGGALAADSQRTTSAFGAAQICA